MQVLFGDTSMQAVMQRLSEGTISVSYCNKKKGGGEKLFIKIPLIQKSINF